jgi:DNA-binding NarL/FixJ family response regulator
MTIQVLLVDDNKTFLTAVKTFLLSLPDVQVVGQAYEGKTAMALAAHLMPDLVLLDIVMPGMNGLEVAAAMQSLAAPPYIVFLSMHDSHAYRAAAKELGALGYVGKGDFVLDLVPLIDRIAHDLQAQPHHGKPPAGLRA